jgi:prepilin-type N-terminal cleavage/methylation domain-containing protein
MDVVLNHLAPLEWREFGAAKAAAEQDRRGTDGHVEVCVGTEPARRDAVRVPPRRESACDVRTLDKGDRGRAGMTVVELLVVMAIVASIMGIGAWSLSSVSNTDLRDDANRVVSAIKYTYANAAINNTEYRIVFDMDTGEYHSEIVKEPVVEHEPQGSTNGSDDDFLTEEAQRLADEVEEESDLFEDDEENPFGVNRKVSYERVKDGVLKTTKLSSDVKFARIIKANNEDEYTHGKVSMSFFPNGFQEQVMIVIASADKEDVAYTLVTEPLTGRVMTYSEEIEVPEGFGEVEEDR